MRRLALLALLVASPAYADTTQNLQVTMTVPFFGPPGAAELPDVLNRQGNVHC